MPLNAARVNEGGSTMHKSMKAAQRCTRTSQLNATQAGEGSTS
jgi:hypothetical protein